MRHYIFCAGMNIPKNKKAIEGAKYARNSLELQWMLEYDCCGASHSKFGTIENSNFELFLENDDITDLINDCMSFARELALY